MSVGAVGRKPIIFLERKLTFIKFGNRCDT